MNSDYSNYGSYNYNSYGSHPISPEATGIGLVILGGIMIFLLIIFLIVYVYMALCLMKMAKKTDTPDGWLAWIPILNIVLMLRIAKKPLWWIILFFIPLVNIVFVILVWIEIAKALGKPEWLGVLMIIPIANLIVSGYLAFSDNSAPVAPITPPAQPAI